MSEAELHLQCLRIAMEICGPDARLTDLLAAETSIYEHLRGAPSDRAPSEDIQRKCPEATFARQ